jgi:hypothetical protein
VHPVHIHWHYANFKRVNVLCITKTKQKQTKITNKKRKKEKKGEILICIRHLAFAIKLNIL